MSNQLLSCAVCGAPMHKSAKSLPQGQATCHSCRDLQRQIRLAHVEALREERRRNRRPRLSTAARGYGYEHERRRKELLPLFIGTPCAVCGELMTADQQLDLDHSVPLRVDPASVADRVLHRYCNAGWNRRGKPSGFDYSPKPCAVCGTVFKPKHQGVVSCSRACGLITKARRRAAAQAAA